MKSLVTDIKNIHEGSRYRIKDKNKAQIYEQICRNPGITRKGIVAESGIRPSTISTMVQQLIVDGLVLEEGRRNEGLQGRPEVPLYPDTNHLCAISLYIVSQELKCLLVNSEGVSVAEGSGLLPTATDNAGFIQVMLGLISSITGSKPEGSKILGICITLPGIVETSRRLWRYAVRWPNLRNVSFDSIEEATGLPLIVNRSLDAELMYLMVNNPGYSAGGTLILHWGYGIGAAYAYDGRIIKTSFGSFCEIGHLVLNPDNGSKCTCGAIGCLETSAALWALLPEFRRINPDVPVDEVEFEKYISGKNIEIFPFVEKAVEAMGHALAILQTVFLPDRIIVYGPLMSNPEIFRKLQEQAKNVGSKFAVNEINVECSGSNFEGDIIGGTSELFQKAFRQYLTSW